MIARRYPGALPFNSKQQNIFYGRDKDIEKLLTLIQVEKQVLLYSKSGLGKTSLLEAGVIPELPENSQVVVWLEAVNNNLLSSIRKMVGMDEDVVKHYLQKESEEADDLYKQIELRMTYIEFLLRE